MIGPGTGVAPFRAFLEERRAVGAKGRNWLFFGDQCAATDFLYRDELEGMRASGHLTRLETAFSRDQPQKIYVQHRILEQAKEVWSWLEEGAHVYVCGDAKRMAKDVDAALQQAIQSAGCRTAEQAADYVAGLKQQKRYQRDVY
jgi:sulfite reductase (NADPH) flavoprotein alpha-component